MKLASSILLILYSLLMLLPLFHNKTKLFTKLFLILCEGLSLCHLVLYFLDKSSFYTLLIPLIAFQLFSISNGIQQGKVHWSHQMLRFFIHIIIFILFFF